MSKILEEPGFSKFLRARKTVTIWNGLLHLVPCFSTKLPEVLQKLMLAKDNIPSWAADKDAHEYGIYKCYDAAQIRVMTDELAAESEAARRTKSDLALSHTSNTSHSPAAVPPALEAAPQSLTAGDTKVHHIGFQVALLYIFHVFNLHSIMRTLPWTLASKADWQYPLETLLSGVWSEKGFKGVGLWFSLNCVLRLPEVLGDEPFTNADSAVFLHCAAQRLPLNLRNPYTILSPPTQNLLVLHWITHCEPASEDSAPLCLKRVVNGMVSGLFQRLALGFPRHFVFGIAGCGSRIEVFAGTWVKGEESGNDLVLAQQQTGRPWSLADEPSKIGTASGSAEPPHKRRKVDGAMGGQGIHENGYEIKIFSLGVYRSTSLLQLANLFLLLQATGDLACKYSEEIFSADTWVRLDKHREQYRNMWKVPILVESDREDVESNSSESTLTEASNRSKETATTLESNPFSQK